VAPFALLILLLMPDVASAQAASLLMSPRAQGSSEDVVRIAVPVAASANLNAGSNTGVAPMLGFQISQRDKFFLGAFFSMSATDQDVKEDFGTALLNPPFSGRSVNVEGNYLIGILSKKDDKDEKGEKDDKDDEDDEDAASPIRVGVGGRWTTTSSNFLFTPVGGTETSRTGFVTMLTLSAQLMTSTIPIALGDETGEFQLGFEIGPTWRLIGGDVGQDDAFRSSVLGTTKSSFAGFETTFFVRVNTVRPFVRFSNFGRPDDVVIYGFTGRQVTWGVTVAGSRREAVRRANQSRR
jgi:hypothetical protein